MRKILVLLFMILFINTCFAANWYQVADKTWFDLSSWRKDGNIISGWFKDLNPGDWDKIKNKKVWFNLSLIYADCNKRKILIKTVTTYDVKGDVLFNHNYGDYAYEDVIPETVGEWKYTVLCNMN